MLYDPKWERKADLVSHGVSLRALITWLETMPADKHYNYIDAYNCVTGQFLRSQGRKQVAVAFCGLDQTGASDFWLYLIASGHHDGETTFGDALRRARAVANKL